MQELQQTKPASSNPWLATGALMAGLSVAAGAFGAHGLDSYFVNKYRDQFKIVAGEHVLTSKKYLDDFKTGAAYQMYHALALIAVGLLSRSRRGAGLNVAGWSFLTGIVLFSGSLYALTLTGQTWYGMIAPIGGTLFLVGWGTLALVALRPGPAGAP